jgi:hypothetical protein
MDKNHNTGWIKIRIRDKHPGSETLLSSHSGPASKKRQSKSMTNYILRVTYYN